jgi:hypothetical protein
MRQIKRLRVAAIGLLTSGGLQVPARVKPALEEANMGEERRRHSRYAVPEEEIFVMGEFSNTVVKVRNIGCGGVQCEYLSADFADDQRSRIDILAGGNDRSVLSNVACSVVYDIKSLSADGPFTGMDLRVCGLRFVGLTAGQQENLKQLLAQLAAACNQSA